MTTPGTGPAVITIDQDRPPDPAYVRELSAALPDITRLLVRQAAHREALDPDTLRAVVTDLGAAASLIPSLTENAAAWIEAEHTGGRLASRVPGAPVQRLADIAHIRLRTASTAASELAGQLGWVQVILTDLRAADGEERGDG